MIAHMAKRNNAAPGEELGLVSLTLDIPKWQAFRQLSFSEGESASVRVRRYIAREVRRAERNVNND
jgi:hypothetical protein